MHRRTGGWLFVACVVIAVPACATGPDVVSTEARPINSASPATTAPTDETTSSTDESIPSSQPTTGATLPGGETTTTTVSMLDTPQLSLSVTVNVSSPTNPGSGV